MSLVTITLPTTMLLVTTHENVVMKNAGCILFYIPRKHSRIKAPQETMKKRGLEFIAEGTTLWVANQNAFCIVEFTSLQRSA
jgi:3-deoxy-D-manno-octulosonic-acid transferase